MGVQQERQDIECLVAEETDLQVYYGHDWYQICDDEMAVFELSLSDMPRVVAVYSLYECAIGIVDDHPSFSRIDDLRAELHWLSHASPSTSEFQRFALLFGVSYRVAHAFFTKHDFWLTRSGLSVYFDERDDRPSPSGRTHSGTNFSESNTHE